MFESYNKAQQAVLRTTLNMIIKKELQATSMALIAKESGVSTGNIYHYFKSKEEIVNELYNAIVSYNGSFVLQGLSRPGTVRDRFFGGWEKVVELSRLHPEGFQFIEQYSFSPYIREDVKLKAYNGGWCAPMNALYQDAMTQRIMKPSDAKLTVQMHYGALVYMIKGHLSGYYELTDEGIHGAILNCWRSVSNE
ncbi:MAG: transcriptional regulator, TetR family [Paenibacillus sp.]|jgi:AcrR family transcriptional regulator|nr:transcriptional regulator, TetR family [Paenibacillus sp.]